MNDWNASLGLANFPFLGKNLARHRANARFYDENLKNKNVIRLIYQPNGAVSSYWVYSLFVENNKPDFMEYMKNKGVFVSQVHARNDTHSVCAPFRAHLPNLDDVERKLVAIPCGWWVTNDQREYIGIPFNFFFVITIKKLHFHLTKMDDFVWRETTNKVSIPRHVSRRKSSSPAVAVLLVITSLSTFRERRIAISWLSTSYLTSLGYDRLRDTGVIDRVQVLRQTL